MQKLKLSRKMLNIDILDFHAHILPRADHGSSSTDVTLFQLQSASLHGITRIVATPHFYPHAENVESFIARRNASYERLKSALSDNLPEVHLGAEVLICDNIEQMPMLDELCISGTKALLLELPFNDFFESYVYSVKDLTRKGYTVILAHADRYAPDSINKLLDAGAFVQLNADAISSIFLHKHIKKWIDDKKVYAIGSDIHGRDKKAYKRFSRAIKRLGENSAEIKSKSDTLWV